MRWVLAFLYWITEGLPVNRQRDQAHHIRGQLTVPPRLGYRSFRNGRERLAASVSRRRPLNWDEKKARNIFLRTDVMVLTSGEKETRKSTSRAISWGVPPSTGARKSVKKLLVSFLGC